MESSPRRSGFSLIEVIITSGLLMFLLGALLWMVVAGKTIVQTSSNRAAVRQELAVALWKISLELRDSRFPLITDGTSGAPCAFSFLSAFDASGRFTTTGSDGSPAWQKYVIYYIPTGTTRLLRREAYGNFTAALSPGQLAAYCDGTGTLISPSVTSMRLTPDSAGGCAVISLTLQATNKHGKVDVQSQDMTIKLRN